MHRLLASLFISTSLPSSGLIFWSADDPPANKETAPTGAYVDSGWQHVLRFKNFQGTMISPKHFITATHLGNGTTVTQPVYFNGVAEKSFTIKPDSREIIQVNGEDSDLSVFEIWESFDRYAPLYTSANEVGKEFVITGKGRGRGDALIRNSETVGWEWGDGTTEADRWGVSTILSTDTAGSGADLIYSQFRSNGGIHECQATGNDSGGGWFIKDGPVWKLAAVTFSADAGRDSNDTVGDNSHVRGAMTKARGFYFGSDVDGWTLIPTNNALYNNPTSFETNNSDSRFYDKTHSYGTRISSFIPELNQLIQPAITNAALSSGARFTAWLNDEGISTQTGPNDDADTDGVTNLLEYFAGSSAGDTSDIITPFSTNQMTSGAMQFTINESLDLSGRGLSGMIEKSDDLSNWSEVTSAVESSNVIAPITGTRTRTLDLAAPVGPKLFFRLKVTLAD
ncbi:hypothetical protein N9105_06790 [Akkermansiaceae bacterium]|nr:hypothetical protein [Akkermansiaceae bacterium]